MTGYVYVIQSSSGLYKVGHTTRPHRRRAELIVATHEELTMLGVVPATMEQEKELHRLLAPWCVAREWFRPCTAMLPLINGLRPFKVARKTPDIHTRLAEYLHENRLTQAQFAERIGTTQATVSRFIRGKRFPHVAILRRIQEETGGAVTAGDMLEAAA